MKNGGAREKEREREKNCWTLDNRNYFCMKNWKFFSLFTKMLFFDESDDDGEAVWPDAEIKVGNYSNL